MRLISETQSEGDVGDGAPRAQQVDGAMGAIDLRQTLRGDAHDLLEAPLQRPLGDGARTPLGDPLDDVVADDHAAADQTGNVQSSTVRGYEPA